MGAWDDMTINDTVIKGLAENLFTDRQSADFDVTRVTNETEPAAKGLLEDILMHPKYGGLADRIDDAGGPTQLLDDLANESSLDQRLERGHALAAIAIYAEDEAVLEGGRTVGRSTNARERLKEWAQTFGTVASYELGYSSSPSSTGGGAFATSMTRHDL